MGDTEAVHRIYFVLRQRGAHNVLMQKGTNANLHYDLYKRSALHTIKHHFTIMIVGGYSSFIQDLSN